MFFNTAIPPREGIKHIYKKAILTHGGASSDPKNSDGPDKAAALGMQSMGNGGDALSGVVLAVQALEDDPRFNAGLGSSLREDGHTIQLDASCMKDNGEFGAVAVVENVTNPILLAQKVMEESSHILLAGKGAEDFAELHGLTSKNKTRLSNDINKPSCDTVGAVAFDGENFAAALSSGGLTGSLIGRVGDVPLPGCGLFCGPHGAVACTGDGEFIARRVLAREVYSWIEDGMDPDEAVKKAIALFDESVDIGLIVLTNNKFGIGASGNMAYSSLLKTSE